MQVYGIVVFYRAVFTFASGILANPSKIKQHFEPVDHGKHKKSLQNRNY
jgi:hypothetical protein